MSLTRAEEDRSSGPQSITNESEKSGGLIETIFYICKNSKVMISVNLCQIRFFIGAVGTVEDILYLNGRKNPCTT